MPCVFYLLKCINQLAESSQTGHAIKIDTLHLFVSAQIKSAPIVNLPIVNANVSAVSAPAVSALIVKASPLKAECS